MLAFTASSLLSGLPRPAFMEISRLLAAEKYGPLWPSAMISAPGSIACGRRRSTTRRLLAEQRPHRLKTSRTSSGNGASKPPPGYEAALFRTVTKSRGLSLGDRACLALGRHLSLPVLTHRQGLGRARSRSRSQAVALMTFGRSRYGDEAANTEGRGFNAPRGCCSKSSSSRWE
jgi:hypothetical protein